MAKTRPAHGTFPTLSFNIKRFLKPNSFNNIPNPYKLYITLRLKLFPKRQSLFRKSRWTTDRAMAKTRPARGIFPTLLVSNATYLYSDPSLPTIAQIFLFNGKTNSEKQDFNMKSFLGLIK